MSLLRFRLAFYLFIFSAFALPLTWSPMALAQDKDSGGQPVFEVGLHMGRLLPNQITGVTEIMPLWGTRVGLHLAQKAYFEGGLIMGSGDGASWQNVHGSFRMDMPIESIVALFFAGVDVTRYEGAGTGKKTFGGGHVGGGLHVHIADAIWFRTDMKFNINPGTSLYFNFGFEARF